MKLYHGTNCDFAEVELRKSKLGKDFGVGFQIRRVEDGVITLEQFLEEIKFNRITTQYFFATDDALKTLKRL